MDSEDSPPSPSSMVTSDVNRHNYNSDSNKIVPSLLPRIKRRTRSRFVPNDFEFNRSNNIDALALSAQATSNNNSTSQQLPQTHAQLDTSVHHAPTLLSTVLDIGTGATTPSTIPKSLIRQHRETNNIKRNNYHKRTKLFISGIPQRLNSTGPLEKHFSKFGTVISITTCYENDNKSALIRYSNASEATAAFRSTEPVLNNRFIKVFWVRKSGGVQRRKKERDQQRLLTKNNQD